MKKTLLMAILGLVLTMGIVSIINAQQTGGFEKPNFFPKNNGEVRKAIENNDYATWKSLMGDKPVTEKINESNFGKFSEMHKLIQNNDVDGAKKIAEELGINANMKNGNRKHGCGCQSGDATKQCGCKDGEKCSTFIDENNDGKCDNAGKMNQAKSNGCGCNNVNPIK